MNSGSLFLARNKMLRLCKLVGYNQFHATRLTTIISEISQQRIQAGGQIEISIKLETLDRPGRLQFILCTADLQPGSAAGIQPFFDSCEITRSDHNFLLITACKNLPDHIPPLTDKRIKMAQEILSTPSREELISDLQYNNDALQKRTADLDSK
ncbi:MAG: hypothetical protein D3909_18540, partial [Candidatus Electrothrix sp. ATG1]|nr:hypothetical protein [Candidatus Electrothrix sp. ATG1]